MAQVRLVEFMDALTEHVARDRGWSLEDAATWVVLSMEESHAEYRAAGAPLGDTEAGLLAWLLPRHQPPTA